MFEISRTASSVKKDLNPKESSISLKDFDRDVATRTFPTLRMKPKSGFLIQKPGDLPMLFLSCPLLSSC